jgi:DNA-binding NtrC family response regulator/tetratricopeptide (TPR) repeat protein
MIMPIDRAGAGQELNTVLTGRVRWLTPMKHLADLLGESPGIEAVRDKIVRLLERQHDARRLPPVLIEGETGTGKGLLARLIHRAGPRPDGPFVDVNCAAIPETLLEAEMFGFERGAFTDARRAKPGLFQAANRGTIFLDEVGLLSEGLQAKLLKVLEERSVRRLGSTRDEPIDAWILTATNEDLRAAIHARRFREDLYHRLAVLTLTLPPLRQRGNDIQRLADHFLGRACADYSVSPKTLTADARAALRAYAWPGNVRELGNLMERVVLLSSEPEVTADALGLPSEAVASPSAPAPGGATSSLDDAVRDRVDEVLRQTNWNISRTASLLGISRNTLRARIEKYGLRSGEAPALARRAEPRRARPSTAPPAVPSPAPAPPAPAALRWERRRVTLLRATLIAASTPETPLETGRMLELLLDKIQSFGGQIEGRSPTGVIAAFGLDRTEEAPSQAAHAAMAIEKGLERYRRDGATGPAIKVAVHTAQVLVGQGDGAAELDLEGKQMAFGALDTLIERAVPDTILVSDATAPFLERGFELVEHHGEELSGGRAFVLAGRERTGLGRAGRAPTFVGRHREIELLWSRLESAIRGQGQIVGISGEAGIGKSRLIFEFRESLAGKPVLHVEGQCRSYGTAVPYLPVLDVLKALCRIAETDSQATMAEKARRALLEAGLDLLEHAPYLLHVLGIEPEAEHLAALGPDVTKIRIIEALRQMLLRRSRENPLVVVVEDLQWIDRTSEECFASLAELVGGLRLLLVSTYRHGYRPPWIEKSYATQVALQPLAPEDGARILRWVLGADHVPDALGELIVAKAEGNPFFLEELARAVRERGGALPLIGVPDTIQEVLLARIERLAPADKRLLEVAAVVGKDVSVSVVRALADMPDGELQGAFTRLKRAEFLYETGAGPDAEYTFKHALTHEVAYESLRPEQRRGLHARIVEAIERLHSDRLAEHVDRLAHHASRGEIWHKAVAYLRQAGAKALAGSAYREAVACFEHALVALSHLPETRATLEHMIDLRFDLRTALTPLGERARIFEHLGEAEAVARTLDDQRRMGRVLAYLTDYFRLTGVHERARESGRRALALADALGDFPLQVAANTYLGQVHYDLGHYRDGTVFLRRNVERLVSDLTFERFGLPFLSSVHSRVWLVLCLSELGEFREGIAVAEEGLRMAEAADHPLSLTSGYAALSRLYLGKGDLARAVPALERGLALCGTWHIRLWEPVFRSWLGHAYALGGRLTDGLPLLEQAIEQQISMGRMASHSARLTSLGEAYLIAGRTTEAATVAGRSLTLARERTERGNEASALRLLGAIAAQAEPSATASAEASYRQAMTLAEELGMRPLLAMCALELGALHRRHGMNTPAREQLTAALELLRAMEMPLWLERAEAEYRDLR